MSAFDAKTGDAEVIDETPAVNVAEPAKEAPAVNAEEPVAPAAPVSTLNQAVQYDVEDPSTFRPSATLHHGPQQEGESRVDYMNRLSRGGNMDRIVQ